MQLSRSPDGAADAAKLVDDIRGLHWIATQDCSRTNLH